jgi:hypothetical protein
MYPGPAQLDVAARSHQLNREDIEDNAMATITTKDEHGMCRTHAEIVNPGLLAFIKS